MGKKDNSKAKEKRAERKAAERKMFEMEALRKKTLDAKMNAGIASIKIANMVEDPLSSLPKPFSVYNKNGLNLSLETVRASDLDEQTLAWAFNTVKYSMKPLYDEARENDPDSYYEAEYGWRECEKMNELREDMAWFLLVRTEEGSPVAFSHFRYNMHFDDEVLYCYDLQVERAYRRKGLGRFMMKVLEMLMIKSDMLKLMCTIFKNDKPEIEFFKTALKFEMDETNMLDKNFQYEILSRYNQIKKRKMEEERKKEESFFPKAPVRSCTAASCC